MALSKLHVRYIQTQNNFYITTDTLKEDKQSQELLYIKDSSHFYFINSGEPIADKSTLTLNFKHKNDFMDTLECQTDVTVVEKNTKEYETALLFFNLKSSQIKQVLLLTLK